VESNRHRVRCGDQGANSAPAQASHATNLMNLPPLSYQPDRKKRHQVIFSKK
jgi:hypothetical protein